jgi:hypothetical protein
MPRRSFIQTQSQLVFVEVSQLFLLIGVSPSSEARQEITRYAGGDKKLNKNSLDLLQ